MQRLVMAAAVALCATQAVAQAQSPRAAIDVANIVAGGWDDLGLTTDQEVHVFARLGRGEAGRPRVWLRSELVARSASAGQGFKYLSAVDFYEADCQKSQIRNLSSSYYAKPMMLGEVRSDGSTGSWIYVIPGSVGETIWEYACSPGES